MKKFLHYVGGNYTPEKFVEEAKRLGITRRVPPSAVRQFSFGDKVVVAYYNSGKPFAFAEFEINGIVLRGEVAQNIIAQLVLEGRCNINPNSVGSFERECGEYEYATFEIDQNVTIHEIAYRAEQYAKQTGAELWFMLGGVLTCVYDEPQKISEPFFRGFKLIESDGKAVPHNKAVIIQVDNYERKEVIKKKNAGNAKQERKQEQEKSENPEVQL